MNHIEKTYKLNRKYVLVDFCHNLIYNIMQINVREL